MSSGSSSIWGSHLDNLRKSFPGRVQVLPVPAEEEHFDNLIIVQKLRVIHSSGWDVNVLLPEGFPDDKPFILFAGYKCPFRWSPPDTMLHEAVDHAVGSLDKLSGRIGPINLNQISNEIAQSNPEHCQAALEADSLKALIDQSTFGIKVQKELDYVWDAIEDTCKKNLDMQPQIAELQQEVTQLQYQVKAGLAGLGARRKDVLEVLPLGSSDGLVRSAKEELKELEDAAAQACKALGSVSASKNLVENMKKKKRRNRLQQQQHERMMMNRSRSPQSTTTTGVHMSFNNNNNQNTNSHNNSPATEQQQDQNNNTFQQSEDAPSATTNNNNNMFVVPDMPSANGTASETTKDILLTGGDATTANTNTSAGSVFSSVAQPPLSFNLEKNNNNRSSSQQQQQQQNDDDDNNNDNNNGEDENDDDDEDEDVMDKAVDYAMKVCMDARRAALLLRRFSAQ